MNRYKQEYVTEFAYILGTMQQEYGNIIDKIPTIITENQDEVKIFNGVWFGFNYVFDRLWR